MVVTAREALPLRFPLKTHLRVMSVVNALLMFGVGGFLGLLALGPVIPAPVVAIQRWMWILRVVFALFAIASIASVVMLTVQALMMWLSFLLVSEEGLEYRYWPSYHVRCTWDDVEAIVQRRMALVTADVLLLRRATELGLPITMKMRKKLGMDMQYFIPLNIIRDWPTGRLADALRHHAPRLFIQAENT